ncbi:MAG: hypothetical protein A2X67_11770 [Ignavibacteria bacterium GWA2_55_11]|nr:MAG: hypothetical protein A2X67_11770 [Ignavibacteria bacterium GWA2_55_11]
MTARIFQFNRDAETLRLIQKGDREGLVRLYRENRRPVVSYVTKNSGTLDDAEDVLQEAVVVLWERIRENTFELQSQLSTFVYATSRNIWLRRLAQARKEQSGDIDPDSIAADNADPEEEVDGRTSAIRAALNKLGEPCRTLLMLFYWERLSMEEIAANMGFANADTAKAKKYQCKEQLRRLAAKEISWTT